MKYNLTKKISYSIIILVLLVGLSLTAIFGMNGKGYGSAKDINLGLDLAGGVSITYEILYFFPRYVSQAYILSSISWELGLSSLIS